jgi:tetratricopeptide (TPR) repeat protein
MSGVNRSVAAMLAAVVIHIVVGSSARVEAQPRNAPGAGAPSAPQAGGTPPGSLDQAARLLFESARTAFGEGDYATALARFRQAYEASPRPGLLFNIATTLDRLRQDDEALATFERFLAADPNVANRTEIEARIRVLRAAIEQRDQAAAAERERIAQQEREAAERAARETAEREAREAAGRERSGSGSGPTPGPARDEGGGTSPVLFFVAGGLTVVAGGLSVWAGLDTLSLNDDYETYSAAPGALQADAKALYDEAASRQLLTNLFLGGTALFGVATAVLLFLTDWGGDAETPATAVTTLPTLTLDANGGVAGFVHRF